MKTNKIAVYLICIAIILLAACQPKSQVTVQPTAQIQATSMPEPESPDPTITDTPQTSWIVELNPQQFPQQTQTIDETTIQLLWAYRDDQRVSFEYQVLNYPLPDGYTTICPVTEVKLNIENQETMTIYKIIDRIGLDEIYSLFEKNRSECYSIQNSPNNFIIHHTTFLDTTENITDTTPFLLNISLGEIVANTDTDRIKQTGLGNVQFTLELPLSNGLTFTPQEIQPNEEMQVSLQEVVISPSITGTELCVEMDNIYHWKPQACLTHGDVTDCTSTYMLMDVLPSREGTQENENKKCYWFNIPHHFFDVPAESVFQVGIQKVAVVNDSKTITTQDCEAVQAKVQSEHPGLTIQCMEFTTHGNVEHWFQIMSTPVDMDQHEAYTMVENSFTIEVPGPGLFELDLH